MRQEIEIIWESMRKELREIYLLSLPNLVMS